MDYSGKQHIYCPDCGNTAFFIGAIPCSDRFAGRVLDQPLDGGGLYRCNHCLLGFRWPRLTKEQLDALYVKGADFTWSAKNGMRLDWRITQDWIDKECQKKECSILDVGCFDGGFLQSFDSKHKLYGIEIHPVARQRAEERGVHIIGSDFENISGLFDIVTAFDVIEHVERPVEFLASCLAATKKNGFVIISSGNLDSFSFRLMGSRYWYCTIAEHISFVSPGWFVKNMISREYKIIKKEFFAHGDTKWFVRLRDAGVNLTYHFFGAGFRALRRLGFGGINVKANPILADHPPGWLSARDHLIIFLQKQ